MRISQQVLNIAIVTCASFSASLLVSQADAQSIAVGGLPSGAKRIQSENSSFRISTTQTIYFGAEASYTSKVFAPGKYKCSNSTFGGDPIMFRFKACYSGATVTTSPTPAPAPTAPAPTAPSAPTAPTVATSLPSGSSQVAGENGQFALVSQQTVYYGAQSSYATRTLPAGSHSCDNATFGDPLLNNSKACYIVGSAAPVPPTPTVQMPVIDFFNSSVASITSGLSATLSWGTRFATSLNISSIGDVTGRTTITVSPTASTNYILTATNSSGQTTASRAVAVTPATPTQPPGVGPFIDVSLIPQARLGLNREDIRNSGDFGRNVDGVGASRFVCRYSHMNFDDPIVYPGQPGRAHLHTYFGNTDINAFSNTASIAGSGNSTCAGGTLNRTGYWVPSMIDTRNGRPIKPVSTVVYYKAGYGPSQSIARQRFPAGLRMIAGDGTASSSWASRGNPSYTRNPVGFSCHNVGPGMGGETIPNCVVGADVVQTIEFPQCWNGRDLDSPNHKSHMAYPDGQSCPSTHPVLLPVITVNVHYLVESGDDPTRWRLSSDTYSTSTAAGYSSHADWWNGWNDDTMQTIVNRCLNTGIDCGSAPIGDGRELPQPPEDFPIR